MNSLLITTFNKVIKEPDPAYLSASSPPLLLYYYADNIGPCSYFSKMTMIFSVISSEGIRWLLLPDCPCNLNYFETHFFCCIFFTKFLKRNYLLIIHAFITPDYKFSDRRTLVHNSLEPWQVILLLSWQVWYLSFIKLPYILGLKALFSYYLNILENIFSTYSHCNCSS